MARVVVVGGGLGGLAAAARLAKLGHDVSLCESSPHLGGAVREVTHDGFRWDVGPAAMTLPATVRDLFRKSGRPLERVLDLTPVTSPRRHVFADGTVLDLPVASRAGQRQALEEYLGPAAAASWEATVDDLTQTWELLRTRTLEVPFGGIRDLGLSGLRALGHPRSLRSFGRARLSDPRTRQVLEYAALPEGSDPGRAPAFTAVAAYVERTFGLWRCPGGFAELARALGARLAERDVAVRLGTEVVEVTTEADGVTGVRLATGEELAADVVVTDVDTRTLTDTLLRRPPGPLRRRTRRIRPAPAASPVLLGLRDSGGDPMPAETVLHGSPGSGEPALVVRASEDPSAAPASHRAVSVSVRGDLGERDPVEMLAGRGLDLRSRISVRVEGPATSYGPRWRGAWRGLGVPANRTTVRGLFAVGATAHPGPGVPYVFLGAAAVAQQVGKA